MGSPPTLPERLDQPTVQELADRAFDQLNPTFGAEIRSNDVTQRVLVAYLEDLDARGLRVDLAELRENDALDDDRFEAIRDRADRAQALASDRSRAAGEQAFDRLNPEFGVPADTRDPVGHQAVRDREAGLALGTRVAVAASRENDPSPVVRVVGQDYRAADAARQAQARQWRGPERGGPER
jgi:hypothetical protein